MDSLPFELVDLIFDYLAEPTDWKSCSRVSLAWTAAAQMRIFRHCFAETNHQCLRLYYTLLHSPHLGEYIRYPAFKIDHQISAQLAAAILPYLKRILRLVIMCGKWTWPGDRPYELSGTLREPLASALDTKQLRTLWFEGCTFATFELQEFFAHAPCLENLNVTKFTSRPFDFRRLQESPTRAKLRTLTVELTMESYMLGDWLCNPICSLDLSELRYLNIEYDPDYNELVIKLISRLLKLVGRSVTDVAIKRIKETPHLPGIPFTFHHNPCIRRLTLQLSPHVLWNPMVCPPQWVDLSIMRLAKPSPIEELIFILEINNSPPELLFGNQQVGLPRHTGWGRMASLLTEESFPALQCVTITSPLPWPIQLTHQAIGRLQMEGMGLKWVFIMSDIYHRPILY